MYGSLERVTLCSRESNKKFAVLLIKTKRHGINFKREFIRQEAPNEKMIILMATNHTNRCASIIATAFLTNSRSVISHTDVKSLNSAPLARSQVHENSYFWAYRDVLPPSVALVNRIPYVYRTACLRDERRFG